MQFRNINNIFKGIGLSVTNQKGMALIATLIFVFVILTMGIALLTMTSNDIKLSSLQEDSTKAFYIAESGIQRSIKELKDNFEWNGNFNDQNEEGFVVLGDGTYTVAVKGHNEDSSIPSHQVQVISTGTVNNSTRKIKIFVKTGGMHSIFEYAIASKKDLKLIGSTEVTGNIYSGGNISIGGSSYIEGNVNAVGEVNIEGDNVYEYVEELEFPTIDTAPYISEAKAGGIHEGKYKVTGSGTETLGPLYINGDFKVTGSTDVILEGTVYVTGEVDFAGSGSIDGIGTIICVNDMVITGSRNLTPANIPVFMSTTGNIKVTGSTSMQLVAYAPKGDVKVTGSSSIYGALIAGKEYKGTGSSSVEYPNLDDVDLNLPPGPFSIVSWQEVY